MITKIVLLAIVAAIAAAVVAAIVVVRAIQELEREREMYDDRNKGKR